MTFKALSTSANHTIDSFLVTLKACLCYDEIAHL